MKNMISMNLQTLRKLHSYTQEEVAERCGVSRQAVAKWESGESSPDISSCIKLSQLYNVSLDDLVNFSEKVPGMPPPPKGKYFFGNVTVGERGQIVIPKKAREVFNIKAGDSLTILGDESEGIGIIPTSYMYNFYNSVFSSLKNNNNQEL